MMIDTHCHLSKEDYEDVEKIIKNMENNIMIVSTASPSEIDEIIELCNQHDNIFGTIGIHPEFADTYKKEDLVKLESALKNPKIVGIGEIGLDYHYTKENKEIQKQLFITQIKLANKYNKTLVIHSRDAIEDTYNIIREYKNENIKCNMHCYSGSLEMAKKFIKLGVVLGIGGVLTFKNEKKLKEIVSSLDMENFILETDSPYLTPEPFRGHKNEPVNIKYVAAKISQLKGIEYTKVLEITTQNAIRQFDLNTKL